MTFDRPAAIEDIRRQIDHPIIDGDGHLIEFYPVVRDLLVEEAGESTAQRLDVVMGSGARFRNLPYSERPRYGAFRYTWWGLPSRNTLDRATAIAPELMRARLDELRRFGIVIIAAGMDGALVSVLGGLLAGVVIAVPTSTGYGAARGGETALHSALASCAPGVVVVNIDSGYGAACAALRVLNARG